jgi:hypothetical protein
MIRDLLRQRLRTLLTVSGVALGIFTLVVLGALGEHFRSTVDEAKSYAHGLVRLYTKTNDEGVNPGITPEDLALIEAMPEVLSICPTITLLYDGFDLEADPLAFMKPKALVEGLPAESAELTRKMGTHLIEGRWLAAGDRDHAMLIDWMARRRSLEIGGPVTIRNKEYTVVGIYHAPDTPMVPAALVPYEALNDDIMQPEIERATTFFRGVLKNPLLAAYLPPEMNDKALDGVARQFALKQGSLFRMYEIVPRDRSVAGTMQLAASLREKVPGLAVIDPERIEEGMEQAVALFLVITLIMTVLSTVVGGLLIVNTMAMAVVERRREIGIKAALGATPTQLALEFVAEAALLSLVGALIGITLAVGTITVCEPLLVSSLETGAALFRITPRLLGFSLLYAGVMGVLSGGIPAARAANVDPAVCLREL